MKDFKFNEPFGSGGICPECGKENSPIEGSTVCIDGGQYFFCGYCGAPSALLENGARFNFNGTIYEIVEMRTPSQTLIATIEISRPGASPLWKPNKTQYQYFQRHHIIECMTDGYREDL